MTTDVVLGNCCYLDTATRLLVATATVAGAPIPKARPRWNPRNGGRPRTPERTKQGERTFAWTFRQQVGPLRPSATHEFGLRLLFAMGGGHEPDVDNLEKLVLDALNGVVWADDRQVTTVCKHRMRGDDARTEIAVYRIRADS